MIVFGGFVDGDRVNTVFRFNFKTSEWRSVGLGEVNPSPRASHSATIADNYMYVFGGKDNDDEKLNDLWRLDLDTDVWEQIIAAPGSQKPIGRYGHSSATYNGHLIVFGGIHEITKELNDMYIFNLKTNVWRRLFKS